MKGQLPPKLRLLIDEDVIIKLAKFDLLRAFTELSLFVGCEMVYPISAHRKCEDELRLYPGSPLAKTVTFLALGKPVFLERSDIPTMNELRKVLNVDNGEAALIAATRRNQNYIMTGDKKCVRALASAPKFKQMVQRFQDNFLSFEQIIWLITAHHGYEFTRDKILAQTGRKVDKAVQDCLLEAARTTQSKFADRLNALIADLETDAQGLLHSNISILL